MIKRLSVVVLFSVLLFGCFYDKEGELHPSGTSNVCDTVNVTYSNQVMSIVNSTCNGCHFSGGVSHYDFSTWADLNATAVNGQLTGSIYYQSGHPPMPPSFHLTTCQLRTIQIWINAGAPQN